MRSDTWVRNRKSAASMSLWALGLGAAESAFAQDRSWSAGFGFWSTPANWSPAGPPPDTAAALIGNLPGVLNDAVVLNQNDTVSGLSISDGMSLLTSGFWLNVNGPTVVTGRNAVPNPGHSDTIYNSWLRIDERPGATLFTDDLTISDGARVALYGGATAVVRDQLRITSSDISPALAGIGSIQLTGSGTTVINDGIIQPSGGDLSLVQFGGGRFDLDGQTGDGVIDIDSTAASSLSLSGVGLADTFSGQIQISGGSTLSFVLSEGWTSDANSLVVVSASASGEPATIAGLQWTHGGELQLSGTGAALIVTAPLVLTPSASVELSQSSNAEFTGSADMQGGVFDLADGAELVFAGATVMRGGAFSMTGPSIADGLLTLAGPTEWRGEVSINGAARQNGTATVAATTTINADTFDLGGIYDHTQWNVNAPLVINTASTHSATFDTFDGVLNIGGGLTNRLTLNLSGGIQAAWVVNGTLNFSSSPLLFANRLAGAPVIVSGGDVNVLSGRVEISADLILMPDADVNFGNSDAILRLRGESNVRDGASFSGAGTLIDGIGGTLWLHHGASLNDVALVNQGTLRHRRFAEPDQCGIAAVDRFTNDAAGVWHVRVGGSSPGTDYDQLVVTGGEAQLAGVLEVELFARDGVLFSPQLGDEFTLLTAVGGVEGTFANSTPTTCMNGHTYHWTVLYGPNDMRIRLDAVSDCCPPDVNGDRRIDLVDLAILLTNFGLATGATQPMGDIDFDGDVDLTDLATLLTQFGTSCA